jgi:hypothetical protein
MRSNIACLGGLLCMLSVAGCEWLDDNTTRRWTEDVLLADGREIVVKREVTFQETAAWGGGAHNTIESASTISFTGELASLPPWSFPLVGTVLYQDLSRNGQWVVVAYTTTCDVWSFHGEPKPPYWEFRLGPRGWQEVLLSPASIDRPANLFHNYNSLDERHVTTAMREKSHAGAIELTRFVRASAKTNCTPAIGAKNLPLK